MPFIVPLGYGGGSIIRDIGRGFFRPWFRRYWFEELANVALLGREFVFFGRHIRTKPFGSTLRHGSIVTVTECMWWGRLEGGAARFTKQEPSVILVLYALSR